MNQTDVMNQRAPSALPLYPWPSRVSLCSTDADAQGRLMPAWAAAMDTSWGFLLAGQDTLQLQGHQV